MMEGKIIKCCGDCAQWNWKKHKCSVGCNKESNPQDHFMDDCVMLDLEEHDKEVIDDFSEKFIYKTVCEGCSGVSNCYEERKQMECEDYKSYIEIAKSLKEGKI